MLKDYLFYQDNWVKTFQGDAREVLKELPAKSIQCAITSPPYWGLRDYGLEPLVWGGDGDCEHGWGDLTGSQGKRKDEKEREYGEEKYQERLSIRNDSLGIYGRPDGWSDRGDRNAIPSSQFCQLCNAWRGNLGLEPTPELYVQHLVEIFRLVKRVLRDDGTVWLNMGDSYVANAAQKQKPQGFSRQSRARWEGGSGEVIHSPNCDARHHGLKPKDLIGIPWRVAFALQADGWYLRSDIIWSKPNPMPESCTDRPTKAHENVFLLSKKAKYFYDADAVREPQKDIDLISENYGQLSEHNKFSSVEGNRSVKYGTKWSPKQREYNPAGRNKRTVWEIATQPFPEAHFAVFPEKLVEPCILAGTSEKGCCPGCGSPWERLVERGELIGRTKNDGKHYHGKLHNADDRMVCYGAGKPNHRYESKTIGWQPTCKCKLSNDWKRAGGTVRCTVLDPFAGTGTVGKVARDHFRKSILIDIKQEYLDMAVKRFKEGVFDFR